MAGKVEVVGDLLVFHCETTDYGMPATDRQPPAAKSMKDLRIVIEPEMIDHSIRQPYGRSIYRYRPNWSRNASEYNATMNRLNSSLLQHFLPSGYEEIGPDIPIDFVINPYMVNEPDRQYVTNGENSFSIKDNKFDLLTTFSYELISFVDDPQFGGLVWKLFRQGYLKFNAKGTFKQTSNSIINLKLDNLDVPGFITYNFSEHLTNEEGELLKNVQNLIARYPNGIEIDLSLLYELFPCVGLDPNSFEIGIENDFIVMSVNKGDSKECDITDNMARQTKNWASEQEMHNFRFISKKKGSTKAMRKFKREERQRSAENSEKMKMEKLQKKDRKKRQKFEDL